MDPPPPPSNADKTVQIDSDDAEEDDEEEESRNIPTLPLPLALAPVPASRRGIKKSDGRLFSNKELRSATAAQPESNEEVQSSAHEADQLTI
ncbi:hypothetical protein V6N13_130762 [Hibiscus sabdariffa]